MQTTHRGISDVMNRDRSLLNCCVAARRPCACPLVWDHLARPHLAKRGLARSQQQRLGCATGSPWAHYLFALTTRAIRRPHDDDEHGRFPSVGDPCAQSTGQHAASTRHKDNGKMGFVVDSISCSSTEHLSSSLEHTSPTTFLRLRHERGFRSASRRVRAF